MTKWNRIRNILQGIATIVFAMILFARPEYGLTIVLAIVGIGMTLRGIGQLIYYFSMARHMVDGKFVLCRGLIFLDLGLFTSAISDNPDAVVIFYIAAVSAFNGLVSILHAFESRKSGSPRWKYSLLHGAACLILAGVGVIGYLVLQNTDLCVYAYAAGLLYSAVLFFAVAFRRSAIVYIA